ncbi:MAG: hypothetical protein AAB787_03065 [Patescibacteria group bacterium]
MDGNLPLILEGQQSHVRLYLKRQGTVGQKPQFTYGSKLRFLVINNPTELCTLRD